MTEPSNKIDQAKYTEIKNKTWLSDRETEIYLLKKHEEFDTIKDVADEIGLKPETAYKYWGNVKNKVAKSRETLELDIT